MTRILLCWELGDDYGHLGKYHRIASILCERGHQVSILVKDLSKVGHFSWPKKTTILYCPQAKLRLQKAPITYSYADILLLNGYHSPDILKYLILAWQHLFDLIDPDLIVFDHSPTALLASRDKKIPRIVIGNPFVVPPQGIPAMNLRSWESPNIKMIEKSETEVVAVINQVTKDLKMTPVQHSSDIFKVNKTILYGYPEIDIFYKERKNVSYLGAIVTKNGFKQPQWKQPSMAKVFAYLKFGHKQSEMVLSVLNGLRTNLVCFYSGAELSECDKYESSTITMDNQLFDYSSVYKKSNSIVCHAGGGSVYPSLYYGLPMILVPLQLEQYCIAHLLETMKLGINIHRNLSREEITKKITEFFSNPIYSENAKRFSSKVKATISGAPEEWACDEIENMIEK